MCASPAEARSWVIWRAFWECGPGAKNTNILLESLWSDLGGGFGARVVTKGFRVSGFRVQGSIVTGNLLFAKLLVGPIGKPWR